MAVLSEFPVDFSTNYVDVLSSGAYTLPTALADIIDNSITGQAKNINVNFVFKGADSYIQIVDDGKGMSAEELREAIQFACKSIEEKRDINDLGRFGIGLNSASAYACKDLFVSSKKVDTEEWSIEMPFAEIKRQKRWFSNNVSIDPENEIKTPSGTIVTWKMLTLVKDPVANQSLLLNRSSFFGLCEPIRIQLGRIFDRFLSRGLVIKINGMRVEAWDPFNVPGTSDSGWDQTFTVENLGSIRIRGYLLPLTTKLNDKTIKYMEGYVDNLAALQGFYVYRCDRLISCGGWLNLPELKVDPKFNFARLSIDVGNTFDEYLSLDISKDTISIPPALQEVLLKAAKKMRSLSSNNYDYKKIKRHKHNKQDTSSAIWFARSTGDGVLVDINPDHPLVKSYTEGLTKTKKKALFSLLEKSFPFYAFEHAQVLSRVFSKDDLCKMLEDTVCGLKFKGKTNEEIFDEVSKIAPFNDERYEDIVHEFLMDYLKPKEGPKNG
jgi:hypothetical protein